MVQNAQIPCGQHSLQPHPGEMGMVLQQHTEAAQMLLACKNTGDALAQGSWRVWDQSPEVSLQTTES